MCPKSLCMSYFFVDALAHCIKNTLLLPANKVCKGYVFTGVCLSTGGRVWLLAGGCVVAPRGCVVALGGYAWLLGGMCMVAPGGHAWLLGGACVVFSMRYSQ